MCNWQVYEIFVGLYQEEIRVNFLKISLHQCPVHSGISVSGSTVGLAVFEGFADDPTRNDFHRVH